MYEPKLSTSPRLIKTQSGALFNPMDLVWRISDGSMVAVLNFERVTSASPSFVFAFKEVLSWYVENRSLRYVNNIFEQMLNMVDVLFTLTSNRIHIVTEHEILNYFSSLTPKRRWYLSSISGFLKKWYRLGLHGVSKGAVELLDSLRIPGNEKGVAVSSMSPTEGPYTEIERRGIHSALHQAYGSGQICIESYLLALLFILLAHRPIQYSLLKVGDFRTAVGGDGSRIYMLCIPRAKQRKPVRTEFKERLISPSVGKLLEEHIANIRYQLGSVFQDIETAPLFPSKSRGTFPSSLAYHQTPDSLSKKFRSAINKLNVKSERTGLALKINPRRFRRTVGTEAARDGQGELIIAEMLDHSDTQNVGVYVQATPEIVARIDSAVALSLAPLAQAFAGKVILNESLATRFGDKSSRIFDPRIQAECQPMGSCGKHGFCGFSSPIACYTCPSFQAWLDGPHQSVLNHLINERERLITQTSLRIASVNDRTILAVADVIRRCDEIRACSGESSHD